MIAATHRFPSRFAAVLAVLALACANPIRGAEGGDTKSESTPATPTAATSSPTNSAGQPSEPKSREESKDGDNGTKGDATPGATTPAGSSTNAPSASKSESEPGGGRDRERRRRGGDRRDRGSSSRGDGDSSSSSSSTNSPSGRPDFSAFKIITERNIFSPTRAPSSSSRGEPRRQPKVENFSLVGTLSYDKGDFAFFDGSGSDFKKALKPDDTIAGHKIIEVGADEVKLEKEGKTIALRIGGQMHREDDGPWEVRNNARIDASMASKSGSDSTGSKDAGADSDAGGAGDDILQRLLKKREQELNK